MAAYPADLPLAEISEVISIARQGRVKEKLAVFAKDVWWIQGFAQKTILGDGSASSLPPNFSLSQGVKAKPENFDALTELEKVVASAQSGVVTAQLAVPWQLILKWAMDELFDLLKDNWGG